MKHFLLFSLLITSVAQANMDHHEHNHEMMTEPTMAMPMTHNDVHHDDFMPHHGANTPATERYLHIHHTMHDAMDIEFSGDPDIDFLAGMIPHHQGAVDMALVELEYGIDGNVKQFANKVIRDQEREIAQMEAILNTLQYERADAETQDVLATRQSKRINKHMHKAMMIDYVDQSDIDFMRGMIPHHQGAIDMARLVLERGTDRRVAQLAQQIISAQTGEIYAMNLWLKRLKQ